jgi:small membrane protein
MSLQPSQIILGLAIAAFVFYVFGIRSILSDRIVYLAFAVGAIILVIDPELATKIANLMGIGRGTDLVLYVFIIFSLFYYVGQATRSRNVERQITDIVRMLAIAAPKFGSTTELKVADNSERDEDQ